MLISLCQVTPLYWEIVQPGGVFYRNTGAVHFTIKAKVAAKEDITVLKDVVLPIGLISGGVVAVGAAGVFAFSTGILGAIGVATEAAVATT